MQVTINRQLLGVEDIAFGTSTRTQIRGGQEVTITEINASNLPFDDARTLLEALQDAVLSANGNKIVSITRTSGDGSPGSTDTYTILYTDDTFVEFAIYNGADGADGADGVQIDDITPSTITTYSGTKTQALHDLQAQSIANLATAQADIIGTGSPSVLVLTTSEQTLPFTVTIPSTNTDVFDFNDAANTVTFKRNASYNFKTTISLDMGIVSTSRTITVSGRNAADNTIVYSRSVTVNGNTGDIIQINSNQLLTVGKNGVPAAPLTLYFTLKADNTGVTLRDLASLFTSSSAYDLPSIEASTIIVTPVGNLESTDVQAALEELDNEKQPVGDYLVQSSGVIDLGLITEIVE